MSAHRFLSIAMLALLPALAAADPAQRYQGLPLLEALRLLQGRGLRIVFSSETVTAAMRVIAEPRGASDKERLGDLLAPHGLRVQTGPRGTLVIVRAIERPPRQRPPRPAPETPSDAPPLTSYHEEVTVEGWREVRQEPGVVSESTLERGELGGLRTVVSDDPIRAAHALPHVAAGDDFRSEFSVRGSAYRHVGVVIDGVATRRLQHTAYGRGNTGSLAMLHGDLVDRATLRAGAYPQRFGSTLGGQLALTVREGSRDANALRIAFSGSNAVAVGEGPLGDTARGSWLFSVRHSYRDWPTPGFDRFDGTVFGFTDALAKIVYDVRPRHQVSFSAIAGQSRVDEPDGGTPQMPGDGSTRTAVMNFGLRSSMGAHMLLTQRAYLIAHQFLNKTEGGETRDRGHEREISYRADFAGEMTGGLIEAGAHVQHIRADWGLPATAPDIVSSRWMNAGYVHYQWRPNSSVVIAPGLRFAGSTLARERPIGRWLLGEWTIDSRWSVSASAGVSHQFPELEQLRAIADDARLVPEAATHVDVGVGAALGQSFRWQATLFRREERDVLRAPLTPDEPWANALDGGSRGVELLVQRRRPTGLSGWVAYSYGRSRYTDLTRDETYWADFDQRHAINAFAMYQPSPRASVALTFRSGSNFPIPGYFESREGRLFAGAQRNDVRLRPYARLDVRASRTFERGGRRLTLYGEVLNVLSRTNVGLSNGTFTSSGEAIGFTERLMPRFPSAGIVIEF